MHPFLNKQFKGLERFHKELHVVEAYKKEQFLQSGKSKIILIDFDM